MIGKLYNAADGWIVIHKSEFGDGTKMYPLHPSDTNPDGEFYWGLSSKEGSQIEFEVVTDSSQKEFAKLIKKDDEEKVENKVSTTPTFLPPYNWDYVFELWIKHQSYSKTVDGLQEFLEKNYLSPYKK